MRATLALTLSCSTVLAAQEARQQASTELLKWRDAQVAIATSNAAEAVKRKQQMEKTIVDLQRREMAVLQGYADVFRDSDPQGLHARFIREAGRQRRPRVDADEQSAALLDSIRRAGNPADILVALVIRKDEAEKFALEGTGPAGPWTEAMELLRISDEAVAFYKSEDNPSNPAARKAYIKASIDHFERAVRLARGIVDFERKRSEHLSSEAASLAKQIEAGKAAS